MATATAERSGTLKVPAGAGGRDEKMPARMRVVPQSGSGSGIRRQETFAADAPAHPRSQESVGAEARGPSSAENMDSAPLAGAHEDGRTQGSPLQERRDGSGTDTRVLGAPAQDRVVLANITAQQWLVHRTYGTYIVPACAPGRDYALVELGPRVGRIDLGDKREFEFPITAREIADDVAREINSDAGEGSDFGVFVCAGAQPSDEELLAAHARLETYYKRLVLLADAEWEHTHNHAMISDVQRRAARWLKLEREWFYEPTRLAECPACGERIRPGVAVCRTCGAVLDAAKAAQFGLAPEKTGHPL